MYKIVSLAVCSILAFSVQLSALPADSCKIDTAYAVAQLRRAADSLDLGFIDLEAMEGWFDNVVICRAVTGGSHWDNIYLATDCDGNVFSFSQGNDSGYFRLIRSILPTYEIDLPVQKIFDGYVQFVVQQNAAHILSGNESLIVLEDRYECVVPPVLERRNSGYLYEWHFRYYSLESKYVYLNSIEFSYDYGFHYCSIQLP